MVRPTTPTECHSHKPRKHYRTPQKAALRNAVALNQKLDLKISTPKLIEKCGFTRTAGYDALKASSSRTLTDDSERIETRSRKREIRPD
ncbi:MAG: hypothetical protein M1829_003185 [Trizodia sp. TS-e1964]|nr:MAG: hypothetical protein M1829_003185 [Trizodia sp. TS-e1964]